MDAGPVLGQQEKHRLVAEYARPYGLLVETGLWNGGGATTTAMELVPGIECWAVDGDPANVASAKARGVKALLGDSAVVLPRILRSLGRPACFWLDAHWAVEGNDYLVEHPCPLLAEIEAIRYWLYGYRSTVLIDDIRLLGSPGWPNLEQVTNTWGRTLWQPIIQDDILRLTPWPLP